MRRPALASTVFGVTLALMQAPPAFAAVNDDTFVSSSGSDNNAFVIPSCGYSNPCRTIQGALNGTPAGHTVVVLTPGSYGTVNLNNSWQIIADGVDWAQIDQLTINAGPGDIVTLRGLVFDGESLGAAAQGVHIGQASAVHMQNCVVRNYLGYGIVSQPSGTIRTRLFISDTTILNVGSTGGTSGIYLGPNGAAGVDAVLDRVHLENNVIGLWADGFNGTGIGVHVVLRDSVVSGNVGDGIWAHSAPGKSPAFVVIDHTASVGNAGNGVLADGPRAIVVLNDDTISRNGTGISAINNGQIISFGNNKNFNNVGPEGAPTGFFSQM